MGSVETARIVNEDYMFLDLGIQDRLQLPAHGGIDLGFGRYPAAVVTVKPKQRWTREFFYDSREKFSTIPLKDPNV